MALRNGGYVTCGVNSRDPEISDGTMTPDAPQISWTSLRQQGPEAYVATPTQLPCRGAIVVGMEIFGVTRHIRTICDRLALEGYAAVAPDFHWRETRRAEFSYDSEGRAQAMGLTLKLRRENVLSDVADARAHALKFGRIGAGTAIVGFSLGGHIAALAATRIPFDLAVSFYGGWTLDGGIPLAQPAAPLTESDAIARHGTFVLGIVGDRDHLISADEWRRLGERLKTAGVAHDLVTYPGALHGFCCDERDQTFDAGACADAWCRLLDALKLHVADAALLKGKVGTAVG